MSVRNESEKNGEPMKFCLASDFYIRHLPTILKVVRKPLRFFKQCTRSEEKLADLSVRSDVYQTCEQAVLQSYILPANIRFYVNDFVTNDLQF